MAQRKNPKNATSPKPAPSSSPPPPPPPPPPIQPAQHRRRDSQPRTASGKRASTQLLAIAESDAREGLRERTEAGHLAAGRTPPAPGSRAPASGAVRKAGDAIRTFTTPVPEDEKLLTGPAAEPTEF